jgi:hypothetical protein
MAVNMVKVKAHATISDVAAGLITVWERRGNNGIDGYAKRGAAIHKVPADILLSRLALMPL